MARKLETPPPWYAQPRVHVAALLVLTALVYAGTLRYQFVFDDVWQIQRNPLIQSWEHLPKYFTGHVWQQISADQGAYYRPVFLVWLRVNHAISGENPAGWHAGSVLLHLIVVFLVYRVARLWMEHGPALFAAAVFALHPVHIESVAWIAGSPDLLLAAFVCGTLLAYHRWREKKRRRDLILALIFAGAALLSKEPAAGLPLLLLGYEWTRSEGRTSEALWRAMPFAALALIYLVVRYWAIGGMGYVPTALSWREMLLSAPLVAAFYVKQLVWPVGLSIFYDLRVVTSAAEPDFAYATAQALSILVLATTWIRHERRLPLALAFFLFLLPVFYLRAFIPGELVHDRYLYVPSIGFALLAGIGYEWLVRWSDQRRRWRLAVSAAAITLMALLAFATAMQHPQWRSETALFTQATRRSPNHPLGWVNLGVTLMNSSNADPATAGPAFNALQRALQLDPENWKIQYNMGYLLFRMKRFAEAEPYLRRSAVDRTLNVPWIYWGFALLELQRWPEAEEALKTGLEIDPRALGIRVPLAVALMNQGKLVEAAEQLRRELELNPNDQLARMHLQRLTTYSR